MSNLNIYLNPDLVLKNDLYYNCYYSYHFKCLLIIPITIITVIFTITIIITFSKTNSIIIIIFITMMIIINKYMIIIINKVSYHEQH